MRSVRRRLSQAALVWAWCAVLCLGCGDEGTAPPTPRTSTLTAVWRGALRYGGLSDTVGVRFVLVETADSLFSELYLAGQQWRGLNADRHHDAIFMRFLIGGLQLRGVVHGDSLAGEWTTWADSVLISSGSWWAKRTAYSPTLM